MPPLPRGIYGETKYLCERLIEQHQRNHDLDVTLFRSGPVYGGASDKPKFIFNFKQKALRDEEITTHKYLNGLPALDLMHVSDMVAALTAVIESDVSGTFHAGTGRSISTAEVARLVVEALDSKSKIAHREIQEYSANIAMDSSRLRSRLDWQPRVVFEDGLRELLNIASVRGMTSEGAG